MPQVTGNSRADLRGADSRLLGCVTKKEYRERHKPELLIHSWGFLLCPLNYRATHCGPILADRARNPHVIRFGVCFRAT